MAVSSPQVPPPQPQGLRSLPVPNLHPSGGARRPPGFLGDELVSGAGSLCSGLLASMSHTPTLQDQGSWGQGPGPGLQRPHGAPPRCSPRGPPSQMTVGPSRALVTGNREGLGPGLPPGPAGLSRAPGSPASSSPRRTPHPEGALSRPVPRWHLSPGLSPRGGAGSHPT